MDAFLSALRAELSELQPYRAYASSCSYCRRPGNQARLAYGAEAARVRPGDYEALLERGWVRSGAHLYQPVNERSCCPNLGVRCDAARFAPAAVAVR